MTNPTSPRALDHQGGIAEDFENARHKPLADYPAQWDVFAKWAVIGASTAFLLWAAGSAVWGWIK